MSTATTDARFAAAMAAMCWGKPSPAEASAIRARQKREATARMRARRLSEGSCTTCGGFVEDCSSECAGCRAKRRERRLRSNSPGLLPRRARWIAEGLCSGCGSAEEREGRARCAKCRASARESMRRSRGTAERAKCIGCGGPVDGRKRCCPKCLRLE